MKGFAVKRTIIVAIIIALVSLLVFALAGCRGQANSPSSASKNAASGQKSQASKDITGEPGNPAKAKSEQTINNKMVSVTLYFGDQEGEYLLPESRQVAETSAIAKTAVEELIKGPKEKGHSITIPAEAKVLNLDVIKEVAYVNFSQELVSKHWGGSTGEQMTVASIVNTLTEFDNIEKVQIMVDGKTIDTIAGHLDISQPLARDESLIKK